MSTHEAAQVAWLAGRWSVSGVIAAGLEAEAAVVLSFTVETHGRGGEGGGSDAWAT